uniref:Uncharacterized protein n=1 Tax=Anguilla anguilla TaxID=7936 RepID=A0A0E9TWY7_ANGAN
MCTSGLAQKNYGFIFFGIKGMSGSLMPQCR